MNTEIRIIFFIIFSIILIFVSFRSLRDRRSHGFYRFFAWEAILAMIVLNIDRWFTDPFCLSQILSWLCLLICTYFVVHSAILIVRKGASDSNRKDPTLFAVEKTSRLVTSGIYKYIRHPMYSSLLFLAWGVYFKHTTINTISLTLAATLFLFITAKIEEKENIAYFGDAYRDYMKRTKMFIPFIF